MRSSKSNRTNMVWPRLPPIRQATIIGLDGIGRQVALQLASLGVRRLQLVDARVVTRRVQRRDGNAYEDIGRPMVHATAHTCHQLNPKLEIEIVQQHSLRDLDLGDLLVCSSGSAALRRSLQELAADDTLVLARCLVRGPVIHIALMRTPDSLAVWPDEGGGSHRPRQVPIHIATLAAGLLVTEYMRFAPTDQAMRSIRFDLQNLSIEVEEPA